MKRLVYLLLSLSLLVLSSAGALPVHAASTNLMANPSVETADASGRQPTNWTPDNWGTNTSSLSYKASGHTGSKSLYATMSGRTDGDAKWIPDASNVTAGQTYTYTDYYESSVATELDAQYTDTSGNVTYGYLTNVAASSSAWKQVSSTFTVPAGVTKVSVLHILAANGWLQTDDFSLTPPDTQSQGLLPNPSVETADPSNVNNPLAWSPGNWGTNTAQFAYVNGGHTGSKSVKVTLSNYQDGDAKWVFNPLTTLTPGSQYSFSAWYKTNTQPYVIVQFTDAAGNYSYQDLVNPFPNTKSPTTWAHYSDSFQVPQGATSVSVFMLISSNGWLQTDDYGLTPYKPIGFKEPLVSLTFDDGWASTYTNGLPLLKKYGMVSTQYLISGDLNTSGYMTTAQAKAFQAQGSEIGAHTVTHPFLTQLTSGQLNTELTKSQTTLRSLFGKSVATDFASPYGDYNQTVLTQIKKHYASHRSTDAGYNSKDNFMPYVIRVQNVEETTTPAQVAAWVNQAKADKTWLVLVYHQVQDNGPTTGDDYGVTPADLDTELAQIKSSGVPVKTMSKALAEVNSQM